MRRVSTWAIFAKIQNATSQRRRVAGCARSDDPQIESHARHQKSDASNTQSSTGGAGNKKLPKLCLKKIKFFLLFK